MLRTDSAFSRMSICSGSSHEDGRIPKRQSYQSQSISGANAVEVVIAHANARQRVHLHTCEVQTYLYLQATHTFIYALTFLYTNIHIHTHSYAHTSTHKNKLTRKQTSKYKMFSHCFLPVCTQVCHSGIWQDVVGSRAGSYGQDSYVLGGPSGQSRAPQESFFQSRSKAIRRAFVH